MSKCPATKKVRCLNDFHNTECILRAQVIPGDPLGRLFISASQVKQAEKKCCGMSECTCLKFFVQDYAYNECSGGARLTPIDSIR